MKLFSLSIAVVLSCLAFPAFAYVGPGAAITLLGSVLGFSSMVFVGIIATIAWPVWLLVKYIQHKKRAPKPSSTDSNS